MYFPPMCKLLPTFICLLSLPRISAFPHYVRLIPNGENVVTPDGQPWHAVGHTSPSPDASRPHFRFTRSEFGRAFHRAGRAWTRSFCMADSDSDGMTNGEELGDPDCVWQIGQMPTRVINISHHPGVHLNELQMGTAARKKSVAMLANEPEQWYTAALNPNIQFPPMAFWFPYVVQPAAVLLAIVMARLFPWLPWARKRFVVALGYFLTLFGMCVGNHRFFSHSAFETGPEMKFFLGFVSGMCMQDDARTWAYMHRVHHRACDQELDFHSPYFGNTTKLNVSKPEYNEDNWKGYVLRSPFEESNAASFWYAHATWTTEPGLRPHIWHPEARRERIGDLLDDPQLWFFRMGLFRGESCLIIWLFLCLATSLYTIMVEKWSVKRVAPLTVYYFGVYATIPIMMSWHSTMLINSATHMWGEMPNMDGMAPDADMCKARNAAWLWPILGGENWHNNHHASPMSASCWVRWYQLDVVYLTIRSMELLGLVWNVRTEKPIARPQYEDGSLDACIMAGWISLLLILLMCQGHAKLKRWNRRLPKTE